MSELSPSGPTPPRPDPWATTAPQEGLRDNDQARIVSLAPSINLTPRGNVMVPLPYNLVDYAGHDESYTPTVRFTSQRAMVLRSFTQHVHGDEQGTGGGVKSGTHGGICEPIGHAPQVLAEGSPVIRHLDRFWMNNRNTVGEAVFVRDTATYAAPPDRDPIPGSAPTVRSEASRAPMTVADSVAPALLGFAYSPPTFAPPIETLPPITGIRPPIGGVGASILLSLAWASGAVVGEWAREVASGEAGDVARQLMIILEEQVPRGTGQGGAIKEADGPLPYVGTEGDIRFANKLLSLKKGEIVDFRKMTPAEFKELVERPWPSAEGIRENERKLEEEKKRKRDPDRESKPWPTPPDGVRISEEEERRRRCKVGPYSEMMGYCPTGWQAHHIVPDYTTRYGTRADSMRGEKRIPNENLPTFWSGPAICLEGNAKDIGTEHWEAHGADGAIKKLGQRPDTPLGTAPFEDVKEAAVDSVLRVRWECRKEVDAAIARSFGNVPSRLLLRTTWPTTGQALGPLSRGDMATLH